MTVSNSHRAIANIDTDARLRRLPPLYGGGRAPLEWGGKMLQIGNSTPFCSDLGVFMDGEGHDVVAVAVKATFRIPDVNEHVCVLADRQVEVQWEHAYYGRPGSSSIRYPVDLIPCKPVTDVVFVGQAHAPNGCMVEALAAALRVGPVYREVKVVGDRRWKRTLSGVTCSAPERFAAMPVVYERAYGGLPPSERVKAAPRFDERNPVGTGYCLTSDDADGMRLPNIEGLKGTTNWRTRQEVVGVGAVDNGWEPRRQLAGTYDAEWQRERCPLLPKDFDPKFFSVAAPGLAIEPHLVGGFPVELIHLAQRPHIRCRLPDLTVGLTFHLRRGSHRLRADLWSVVIEPDEGLVMMVWGGASRVGKRLAALERVDVNVDGKLSGVNQ